MLTARECVILRGNRIDQLRVGHQRRSRQAAFDQIVAENVVRRKGRLRGDLKGRQIVDSLARETAFAKHILINVRHRGDIRVEMRIAGKDPREQRLIRAHWADANPRLENRIAALDARRPRARPRPIERVRDRAHQSSGGSQWKLCVGVQRDYESHVDQIAWRPRGYEIGRAGRTAQQPIEFGNLAVLSLPTHPLVFERIPAPAALKQPESRLSSFGIATVQFSDSFEGRRQQFPVFRHFLLRRVQQNR